MLLSFETIKTLLSGFGISDLAITFESAEKVIIAEYTMKGQQQEHKITFAEIEDLFRKTDVPGATARPVGAALGQSNALAGSK